MNKRVIFTIVAKNYLALAKTLVDSAKSQSRNNGETQYYVFVADEFEKGQTFAIDGCTILEAKTLSIDGYYDLAFKYDITEFCTALKPFCMDYLAGLPNVTNVIYFDPDIYLFDSLESVYGLLGEKLCVLTPHFITPETHYSGIVPEEMILWAGILNLGFIAVNIKNPLYKRFIDWWKNRLYYKCFADKQDGLHTDQKWIDFLPSFFPNDVVISSHMGHNMSIWNLHERKLILKDEKYYVKNQLDGHVWPLIFFHFSGFDLKNEQVIHKHHPALSVKERPEMAAPLSDYRKNLIDNGINTTVNWSYTYNKFQNGKSITQFQRRVFRRLKNLGTQFGNPFQVSAGTYYSQLETSNMLVPQNKTDAVKAVHIEKYAGKIKLMLLFFIFLKKLLGINKYTLLLKFLFRYSRPENQTFLIKEYRNSFEFYNENRVESTRIKDGQHP